jgi:glycosyltransferase involved in cell wall biosynthesis
MQATAAPRPVPVRRTPVPVDASRSHRPDTPAPLGLRGRCEVLHVSSVHPCDDVRIIYRECAVLRHAGFDVEAAFFDVPEGSQVAGVPLVSLGPRPSSRLGRALVAMRRTQRLVRELRPRVVHLHDPELLPLVRGLKARGLAVFYDAHEDLPRQVFHKPWIPGWARGWVSRQAERLLPRLLAHTDAVVVAASHINAGWMTGRPRVVLRNMPLASRREHSTGGGFAEREPAVVYAGLLSPARALHYGVKAALRGQAHVYLAGRGDEDYIDSLLALAPDRVTYVGNLEPERLDALLSRCRLGLALLPPSPAYLEAVPSKVFDYLKAGLPFVWSDFPHWRDVLEGRLTDWACDPSQGEAVAAVVASLVHDESAWQRARAAVLDCARHYPSAEEESAQLVELYQNTLEVS